MANQIDDKPSLPKEYTQLKYLESLPNPNIGMCVIDTGIYAKNTISEIILQGNNSGSSGPRIPIGYSDYYGTCFLGYKDKYYGVNSTSLFSVESSKKIKAIVKFTTAGSTKIVDASISDEVLSASGGSYISVSNIKLFGPYTTMNSSYNFIGKIFYCKISDIDSDTVLGEYIPALRIADSKPGMYDLVSGQFFTNKGPGEFTYG